jgi:hypothetical protein
VTKHPSANPPRQRPLTATERQRRYRATRGGLVSIEVPAVIAETLRALRQATNSSVTAVVARALALLEVELAHGSDGQQSWPVTAPPVGQVWPDNSGRRRVRSSGILSTGDENPDKGGGAPDPSPQVGTAHRAAPVTSRRRSVQPPVEPLRPEQLSSPGDITASTLKGGENSTQAEASPTPKVPQAHKTVASAADDRQSGFNF